MNILKENISNAANFITDEFQLTSGRDKLSYFLYKRDFDIIITVNNLNYDDLITVKERWPENVEWLYHIGNDKVHISGKYAIHLKELLCAIDNCKRLVLLRGCTISDIWISEKFLNKIAISFLLDSINVFDKKLLHRRQMQYVRRDVIENKVLAYKKRPLRPLFLKSLS